MPKGREQVAQRSLIYQRSLILLLFPVYANPKKHIKVEYKWHQCRPAEEQLQTGIVQRHGGQMKAAEMDTIVSC